MFHYSLVFIVFSLFPCFYSFFLHLYVILIFLLFILTFEGYFSFMKRLSCRMRPFGTYFFTQSHPQRYISLWFILFYMTLRCFAFQKSVLLMGIQVVSGFLLLLSFGYYEQCCYEHLCICPLQYIYKRFSWVYPTRGTAELQGM